MVEAKLRCHAHVFCSQIERKQHQKHPQNLKPNNAEQVSITTTQPTVFHGKPPRKRTMFFSLDRPKPLGCVSRKMVSLREALGWGGKKRCFFKAPNFLEVQSLSQSQAYGFWISDVPCCWRRKGWMTFSTLFVTGSYFESCGKLTRLGTSAFSICMVA